MSTESFANFIPRALLPPQLVADIEESEQASFAPNHDKEFLLLLVVFLNDFCHASLQYIYGIDDRLEQGGVSAADREALSQRRQLAENVNDYVQIFCKIIDEGRILQARTLLHIVRKYVPCSLVVGNADDVPCVLDCLQDSLMTTVPDIKKHASDLRLSVLWLRFKEELGGLIETATMDDLWAKLCHAIQHAHAK